MSTTASGKTTMFYHFLKEKAGDVKQTIEKAVFIHHGATILHEWLC
jgi:hypothetical protein